MNRGEKRGTGRQGSPQSANKNRDQAGGAKGIHMRRRETNSAHVFGAEVFLPGPERGCRAEIRAPSPGTKQKHFYVRGAHCQCTERPSGPGSVNATVLVQTVSCVLNCSAYLSIYNLWTAYFQCTCLTVEVGKLFKMAAQAFIFPFLPPPLALFLTVYSQWKRRHEKNSA